MLELRGVTKRFPGVLANDSVSLELREGEVLALLGENGAGKSTLISVMYGLYRPEEGQIFLDGREVQVASPAQALQLGIGLVPQHPMLVSRHTVAENLALGLGAWLFPVRAVRKQILELSERYGLAVQPDARVLDLSPGEKQRVEILRSLLRGARVLILDEPTSVLTPQEARGLFSVMRELRADGKSLVFISHKLDEVLEITDRVVVLRRGRVAGEVATANATRQSLAGLMVGKSVDFERRRLAPTLGGPLLRVHGLTARSSRGLPALRGVSFTLHRGEVLGVAGVAGNGQSELVEVLSGLTLPDAGEAELEGRRLEGGPAELFRRGVAHIPEDRLYMGTVPSMSVSENLALRGYAGPPYSRRGLRDLAAQDSRARWEVEEYAISTPGVHTPSRLLSGGNIQKVILARELAGEPRLILAVHPTYGLDIGATEQVHGVLLERTRSGAGLLLVSEDLEELMSLSDRIAVMYHGELLGPFPVAEVTRERLGLLMTGGDGGDGVARGAGDGDLGVAVGAPGGVARGVSS